jgi:hypothetical protein
VRVVASIRSSLQILAACEDAVGAGQTRQLEQSDLRLELQVADTARVSETVEEAAACLAGDPASVADLSLTEPNRFLTLGIVVSSCSRRRSRP